MLIMGEKIDLFDLPVCNIFRHKMLEGQLCYTVEINKLKDQVDAQEAVKQGILVVMDYNHDKVIRQNNAEGNGPLANDLHFKLRKEDSSLAAKIYIETLGRRIAIKFSKMF